MVLSTSVVIFNIKGGTIHTIFFHYFPCYFAKICINFLMTMKGCVSKEMVERMKGGRVWT